MSWEIKQGDGHVAEAQGALEIGKDSVWKHEGG